MKRFLVTNDDGISAPGLRVLANVAARFGTVTVLAPDCHCSGCSHRATTDKELTLDRVDNGWHSLDGTPVDCTRVGLTHLAPDVEWVLAGVNDGGNLGADLYLSGTVAAIREAALLGKPGIAISQFRRRNTPADWQRAASWTEQVLKHLFAQSIAPGEFWNVNLPDPVRTGIAPGIVHCCIDPHPLPVAFELVDGRLRYRGNYQERPRAAAHDVETCFGGQIAVTRVSMPRPVT